ncbi:MAG TPA: 4'-phosphopantetheinyl transferase superfamily protein [Kofleriaceae bacterium]|nr:4'-phosphopantetheinyl transferase superfamily protein [Kofleriaceae bacterium]
MERVDSPHGLVVVGAASCAPLPGEVEHVARLAEPRRREFLAGRAVLRAALGRDVAILPDDRGAPVLPPGFVGSISHKGDVAAAIVAAAAGDGAHVGIDLERAVEARQPIERRILTAREQAAVRGREVTLAFAIKEAIYKALDPFVRRYVGFTEVELDLATRVVATALPFAIDIWWCEHAGYWLATARATRLAARPTDTSSFR